MGVVIFKMKYYAYTKTPLKSWLGNFAFNNILMYADSVNQTPRGGHNASATRLLQANCISFKTRIYVAYMTSITWAALCKVWK